jgi:hypothetical protein
MDNISRILNNIDSFETQVKHYSYDLIALLANNPELASVSSTAVTTSVITLITGRHFLSTDETLISKAIRKSCLLASRVAFIVLVITSILIIIIITYGLKSPKIDNEVLMLYFSKASTHLSYGLMYGGLLGACIFYFSKRKLEPFIANVIEAFSRKFTKEYIFPEFKNLDRILPHSPRFSLAKVLKKARKKDSIFFGACSNGEAILVSFNKATQPNYQILGETGSGKGVFLSLVFSQFVGFDAACILFCPKPDDQLANSLHSACIKNNQLFVRANLASNHAVINPLFEVNERELFLLIKMTFELQSSGEGVGYYVLLEREFAQLISEYANDAERLSLNGLYEYALSRSSEVCKEALGLIIKIKEIATLPATQTYDDAHLLKIFENGGCLLIEGNTEDESVLVLMRMLIHRVCQITVNRKNKNRKVCVAFDEAKYCLTTSANNYLGTIRSANGCFYLAHQSNADFESVQLRMPPAAVRESCLDNLTKRIVYKTTNYATASYISDLCGTKLVRSDLVNTVSNELAAETQSLERKTSKVEVPNIHTNIVQNLPSFCAIAVGIMPEPTYMFVPIIKTAAVQINCYVAKSFDEGEGPLGEDLL